jgi:hypothetical protein
MFERSILRLKTVFNNDAQAIRLAFKRHFRPDIIHAGQVQLNKISQYLTDLPDSAVAELLVSPQDLAKIDRRGLDTWDNSIRRIREIEDYHGLDGMKVFSSSEASPDVPYEKEWANQIKAAFNQARATGKTVTTGLFMPTNELIHGGKIGTGPGDLTVENNIYSLRNKLADAGGAFVKPRLYDDAQFQWSSTERPDNPRGVFIVDFADGANSWSSKNFSKMSSRPVSLGIQP